MCFGLVDRLAAGWAIRRRGALARARSDLGRLAGLSTTAGREWTESTARRMDLAATASPRTGGGRIVEELLARGPSEVGLDGKARTLESAPVRSPDSVGAGRSDSGRMTLS